MTIYSLDVLLSQFGTSLLFMFSSNCCFLTYIQVSQEAGKAVWYSHLFKNFPQFVVIHTLKGFGVVNEENRYFLKFSCFFYDPMCVLSCSVMSNYFWPHGVYRPWSSPGQNTGVGAFPFSRGSSQPRDWTQVSHTAGRFFTSWATREAPNVHLSISISKMSLNIQILTE